LVAQNNEASGRRPLRAAIVACGDIAQAHAASYLRDRRVELVACAEVVPERLAAFADQFDIVGRYTDYTEMMERERPDIVSICSHHHLHAPMTVAVAGYRPKAILCEKPIALNLGEADAMIAACRDAGVLLVIGHQRRFASQYMAAQEAIAQGRIGDVTSVEAYGHPRSSLLLDCTHAVDLVRFFLGDPQGDWVIGQIDARERREGWGQLLEGCALAWIAFQGGVHLLLGAGSVPPEGPDKPREGFCSISESNYLHIAVHGTTGRLEVDGDAPHEGRPLVHIHRGAAVEEVPLSEPHDIDGGVRPFAREIAALVDCLETPGLRHPLEAMSARTTLEILMAIYESSRRREAIRLPLAIADNPFISMLEEGSI
jgi:UDP-N-acetylglucosamine 3-dehydrogenase